MSRAALQPVFQPKRGAQRHGAGGRKPADLDPDKVLHIKVRADMAGAFLETGITPVSVNAARQRSTVERVRRSSRGDRGNLISKRQRQRFHAGGKGLSGAEEPGHPAEDHRHQRAGAANQRRSA